MNPPLNIEDPIRAKILALKRPLPHEAEYMIEAELEDLVELFNKELTERLQAIIAKNTDDQLGTTDYDGIAEDVIELAIPDSTGGD
jgi:hypothetical protein